MKKSILNNAIILLSIATLAGCNFIGSVFKTGIGVGIFIVLAILVILLMVMRRGRRDV
jgi:hypothetical protein